MEMITRAKTSLAVIIVEGANAKKAKGHFHQAADQEGLVEEVQLSAEEIY